LYNGAHTVKLVIPLQRLSRFFSGTIAPAVFFRV
jgi:hypothetical protein